MKYLLTSAGTTNDTIRQALVDLLPKPLGECNALAIATGMHPFLGTGWRTRDFFSGANAKSMCALEWGSVGVLELTALPSIDPEIWKEEVRTTDALLVWGGHALYLAYWMRESGLADLMRTLGDDKVYVGCSAGSMALSPDFGSTSYPRNPPLVDETPLGIVGFSIAPHLDHPEFPDNSLAELEKWAAPIQNPAYAIDDESAIVVDGDRVEVVSEGHWHLFE